MVFREKSAATSVRVMAARRAGPASGGVGREAADGGGAPAGGGSGGGATRAAARVSGRQRLGLRRGSGRGFKGRPGQES